MTDHVKRFECVHWVDDTNLDSCAAIMSQTLDGGYVCYADYEQLQSQLAQVTQERDRLHELWSDRKGAL